MKPCVGLASHPEGSRNTPCWFCYRNRDKLQPEGPLGSYADFTLTTMNVSIFVSAYSFLLSVLYFHDHCKYPDVLDYSDACVWRERRVLELMFWFISWCCGHNFCCQYAGSFCCIQVLVFSIQLL